MPSAARKLTLAPGADLQVQEQVLKSFGIETCSDLVAQRGLLSALFSKVPLNHVMSAGQNSRCLMCMPQCESVVTAAASCSQAQIREQRSSFQDGLLGSLFVPCVDLVSVPQAAVDYFMHAGLGLGQTQHRAAVPEGEVGRKGISCERTFAAISAPADLEAKVLLRVIVRPLSSWFPRSIDRIVGYIKYALVLKRFNWKVPFFGLFAWIPSPGATDRVTRASDSRQLAEIAEHLAGDMAREKLQGRTLTLKLKSATTFEVQLCGTLSSTTDLQLLIHSVLVERAKVSLLGPMACICATHLVLTVSVRNFACCGSLLPQCGDVNLRACHTGAHESSDAAASCVIGGGCLCHSAEAAAADAAHHATPHGHQVRHVACLGLALQPNEQHQWRNIGGVAPWLCSRIASLAALPSEPSIKAPDRELDMKPKSTAGPPMVAGSRTSRSSWRRRRGRRPWSSS